MFRHTLGILFSLALAGHVTAQGIQRVSVDSAGSEENGSAWAAGHAISYDGTRIAFQSLADNLVPGDLNSEADIFVHDRLSGHTELVSLSINGGSGNGPSRGACISGNGRYVVFESLANDLVPGDTNGTWDVFVRDLQSGTTERVSLISGGGEASAPSSQPSISFDGRMVVFLCLQDLENNTPRTWDYDLPFVHDRLLHTTTLLPDYPLGPSHYEYEVYHPVISGDGGHVAFVAAKWLPFQTSLLDIQVYESDLVNGRTFQVSVDSNGHSANDFTPPDYGGGFVDISFDGQWVAFASSATNLTPHGVPRHTIQMFVHDVQSGRNRLVSRSPAGLPASGASRGPGLSPDGRFVAYWSTSTNLVEDDSNALWDVFVTDLVTRATRRVNVDAGGGQSYGQVLQAQVGISEFGRYCSFSSFADDLVAGDSNSAWDVFVSGGPELSGSGACPGWMTLTASKATPGGPVAFVWGDSSGGFLIPPGRPCAPLQLDLIPSGNPPPGYAMAIADPAGVARVSGWVPPRACGALALQAVDLTSCSKSNRIGW